jgi:hypothetical protein
MGVLLAVATDAGSVPVSGIELATEADEVEAVFRLPISQKNLLDRPLPTGVPAGFSLRFALVRSNPQRFDSVLSIVV